MYLRGPAHGPKLLLLTLLLVGFYIYGYVDQIGENNRSVSVYAEETVQDD